MCVYICRLKWMGFQAIQKYGFITFRAHFGRFPATISWTKCLVRLVIMSKKVLQPWIMPRNFHKRKRCEIRRTGQHLYRAPFRGTGLWTQRAIAGAISCKWCPWADTLPRNSLAYGACQCLIKNIVAKLQYIVVRKSFAEYYWPRTYVGRSHHIYPKAQ